jgi:hypothetical protein
MPLVWKHSFGDNGEMEKIDTPRSAQRTQRIQREIIAPQRRKDAKRKGEKINIGRDSRMNRINFCVKMIFL